jgi:ribosome modulation factor
MSHDATAERANYRMVAGDVAGHSADRCAFQTSRCVCRADGRQ